MTKTLPDPIRPNAGAKSSRPEQSAGWQARRALPEGPLDIVGDIHGEIDALRMLMNHLGYDEQGNHPQGRKLVFVGDLVDRGPDSPGVVRLVAQMVARGVAFAVMGNHDLSVVTGRKRSYNAWLFGHESVEPFVKPVASESDVAQIQGFLRSLPLALERSDLRVVHAYWDDQALKQAKTDDAGDATIAFWHYQNRLQAEVSMIPDELDRKLAIQNRNPVRLITSGPEGRASASFFAGGKWRMNARLAWWEAYAEEPVVVFGHYWRLADTRLQADDQLLSKYPINSMLGRNKAICIDYSVGGRWIDRRAGSPQGPFRGRLAALRWPERELMFDDGEQMPVVDSQRN